MCRPCRTRRDDDAKSVFASCGDAAALALGSNVQQTALLFDYLVGAAEQRERDGKAEGPGSLEVRDGGIPFRCLRVELKFSEIEAEAAGA